MLDPRYPVGRFDRASPVTTEALNDAIATLAAMPAKLRAAVAGLDEAQLNTPYRDGGWTVRQLVHHIADSHMNAVIRVKLALTEDWPTIMVYDEKLWAELPDSTAAIAPSLELIDGLHARWAVLLSTLSEADCQRGFKHPERGPMSIGLATMLYAWHARHHVAHIAALRAQKSW
jgi:hypothetical protein